MTQTFYFCKEDLVGFFTTKEKPECPVCSKPMPVSGWMQSKAENGPDGSSEALTGQAGS